MKDCVGRWAIGPMVLATSLLAACSANEGEGTSSNAATGPLYLAATWVTVEDVTNTYIALIDSLDADELDLSNAVEIGGFGDAWVYEDMVLVAEGESPEVARYTLNERGTLEEEERVSFAEYGVAGAAFWDQQVLSPTKAYLASASGQEYIVWNPTTMEITGTVPWPELDFGEGLQAFHSYTDRGGVVADGLFFHGIYGHDENFYHFGDRSFVTVWDIETDELVDTIEVPCPMMDVASLGDDGYLYVSGWSYMPLSYNAGYSEMNCAARIDVKTRELDEDWLLDYSEALDGEQGSALRAVQGSEGIFAVFHGSGIKVTDGIDIWDLDIADDDWELYSIDLDTREVEPTGVLFSDGSYYESHIGDDYYVYLGAGTGTQVYRRTDDGYEKALKSDGWLSRLFRLR